ncbi:GNAT family N-acetyltransferase [Halomarina oriensis]|uniref:GNAT family N-acetyltransferase n=1 Tax=Halomarina oriensis TaxID=671145 RepID=A0A6B0GH39_9EURY|nr:GNAT family N-acetyltransferase [Halomarina oriensis]
MTDTAFLSGAVVDLQPVDEADVAFLTEQVNDPRVWQSLGLAAPVNDQQGEQWFGGHVSDDASVDFLVVAGGDPVGTVDAFDLDERNGHATLGCWLAPQFHDEGDGTDATRTMLRYLFDHRRLRTVAASVFAFNDSSVGALEAAGMHRVGTLPDWEFVDGRVHDTHIYAVTAET